MLGVVCAGEVKPLVHEPLTAAAIGAVAVAQARGSVVDGVAVAVVVMIVVRATEKRQLRFPFACAVVRLDVVVRVVAVLQYHVFVQVVAVLQHHLVVWVVAVLQHHVFVRLVAVL